MSMPEPFDAFVPLREAVARAFDDGLLSPERLLLFGRTIPVDILDRPDEYVIEASLPRINPAHMHISTSGNTLTIQVGRAVQARQEDAEVYLKRERVEHHGPTMSRTLTLPTRIDPEKVSATYEHGVLTIIVAKDEEAKPHKIVLHVPKEKAER